MNIKKRALLLFLILVPTMLIGCENKVENKEINVIESDDKQDEETVINIPLEKESFVEPEINNGASYIKSYNGNIFYADNHYLRLIQEDSIVLPDVFEPMVLDIYKNTIYYLKDDNSILYSYNLEDFSRSKVFNDVFGTQAAAYGGMFIIAEGKIYYSDRNLNLCSRSLTGENKKILSNNKSMNIKYRTGWLYFKDDIDGKLWRIKTDGSEEECIVKEAIDYYYLTTYSIVYQTAQNNIVYIKELKDGSIGELLIQIELTYIEMMSSRQFQLLRAQKGEVIYYQDTGESYTLYKYTDGEVTQLQDLNVDTFVYPLCIIDPWVYCFGGTDSEIGFYKVHIDGTELIKIGDSYRVPAYLWE